MPDLTFSIVGASHAERGMTPLLTFELALENTPEDEFIQSVILQVQIRIESVRRAYSAAEKERLRELFGMPAEWGRTLHDTFWTHAGVNVPSFRGRTTVALPVACTFDLNVASTKYFYGLDEGEIPLIFLFSGTVFYERDGRIMIQRISWEKEARFRMPVAQWQSLLDQHYPGRSWIMLDREVLDRLYAFKRRSGVATWDEAVSRLLADVEEPEVAA